MVNENSLKIKFITGKTFKILMILSYKFVIKNKGKRTNL